MITVPASWLADCPTYARPDDLSLAALRAAIAGVGRQGLWGDMWSMLPRPVHSIAPGWTWRTLKAGWAAPGGATHGWGVALSGGAADDIEFDLAVSCLTWAVRATFEGDTLMFIRIDPEPWERLYLVQDEVGWGVSGPFVFWSNGGYTAYSDIDPANPKPVDTSDEFIAYPPLWWVEANSKP